MKWEEPASRGRRRLFFSVARCYDTGEAGHRSQTRWSQGRAGGGSLITVTSWYLPTARWQHRACTREEKRVGSSANLNQCPLFFFFYSSIFPSTFCRSFSPWIHLLSEPLKKSVCLRQTACQTFSQLLLDSTRRRSSSPPSTPPRRVLSRRKKNNSQR